MDEKGRLVFFPFWPLGRRGYLVPDEPTAATLREQHRRLQWWSRLIVWVPIPLSWIVYGLGLRPGWFFVALGGDLLLVIAAMLAWWRRVVRDLNRAPRCEMFGYRRRLADQAAATRVPFAILFAILGVALACLMLAVSLFCLAFPFGHTGPASTQSDFGGLPHWAVGVLSWVVGLSGLVLSGLLLAAFVYQIWFLMTHRDEVRRRRHAARLWG